MFKVGPIRSKKKCSDESWDEKGHTMISTIYVTFNDRNITSIQFSYFQNGAHVVSKLHGSSSKGQHFKIVRLSHDEYVTGLSGLELYDRLTSLTFHTNLGKHGPFCEYAKLSSDFARECTREIGVIRDRREFGGFFGSFDGIGSLTSIGIYFRPITSTNDAVLGTKFGLDTYDHQLGLNQTWDPIANRTLDHQIPKMVDGFPVKPIRYKPKLKDRIFSKLDRALSFVLKVLLDD